LTEKAPYKSWANCETLQERVRRLIAPSACLERTRHRVGKQVADRGKKIVIAEIGWPSAGGRLTTPENERVNYQTTKNLLSGATPQWALDTFWFEMFDEPWKTDEGVWGPYWGLYTSDSKPKFDF
jgi:exo-beta-1,3-glucanase (GH17 family)